MTQPDSLCLSIGAISTLLFILKVALAYFPGNGADLGDQDMSAAAWDHAEDGMDPGFKALSLQSLLAFGMGFGWASLALLQQTHLSPSLALALGSVNGLAMAALSTMLLRATRRLGSASPPNRPQLGDRGRTVTDVPGKRRGSGLVQLFDRHSGQARQMRCLSDGAADIPPRHDVVVVALSGAQVLVEPFSPPRGL